MQWQNGGMGLLKHALGVVTITLSVVSQASAGEWSKLPGSARDIGIGANNVTYIVGVDSRVFRWNGGNWQVVDGRGVAIAVGPRGIPWLVNGNGEIWRRARGGWTKLTGAARDIAVGGNGRVYVIGTDSRVLRLNGSGWQPEGDGAGKAIAVDPRGVPWVVGRGGEIWRRSGTGWTKLPGAANDIAIGGDGTVFVIGSDHRVLRRVGNGWQPLGDGSGTRIAVDASGRPWIVGRRGGIWRWSRSSTPPPPPVIRPDTTAPRVAIVNVQDGFLCKQSSLTVDVQASDNRRLAGVSVNGVQCQRTGRGTYRAQIRLRAGRNRVVAEAWDQAGNRSKASVRISADWQPPQISAKARAMVTVSGRVDDARARVTIGGRAIRVNRDGSFSVQVPAPRSGYVTVIATDAAGNQTRQKIPVQ